MRQQKADNRQAGAAGIEPAQANRPARHQPAPPQGPNTLFYSASNNDSVILHHFLTLQSVGQAVFSGCPFSFLCARQVISAGRTRPLETAACPVVFSLLRAVCYLLSAVYRRLWEISIWHRPQGIHNNLPVEYPFSLVAKH
jgi:hypothetical protein